MSRGDTISVLQPRSNLQNNIMSRGDTLTLITRKLVTGTTYLKKKKKKKKKQLVEGDTSHKIQIPFVNGIKMSSEKLDTAGEKLLGEKPKRVKAVTPTERLAKENAEGIKSLKAKNEKLDEDIGRLYEICHMAREAHG